MSEYSAFQKQLLNDYQHDFPLTSTPFADIAAQLGTDEASVIEHYQALADEGAVSRIGPVFRANRVGASTLAAMCLPESELQSVAETVSSFIEVNHNYEREHRFNLWFVANAGSKSELHDAISRIEQATGYPVMQLPMLKDYYIDLGFSLQWT